MIYYNDQYKKKINKKLLSDFKIEQIQVMWS